MRRIIMDLGTGYVGTQKRSFDKTEGGKRFLPFLLDLRGGYKVGRTNNNKITLSHQQKIG